MENPRGETPVYVLGHSEAELERLTAQNRFFGELTAQIFAKAGIGPGMRVLDVGCGAGDVALLVAQLVSPEGAVFAVDKSGEAIATARKRAKDMDVTQITFLEGDAAEISFDRPFDAAVGRFVLMYAADPSALLRQVAAHVRPDGIVAFQEMDITAAKSVPRLPLFEENVTRLLETFRRGRVETQMGLKLHAAFVKAGLPAPEMLMSGRVESAARPLGFEVFSQTIRTLLPMMEKFGIAKAAEVEIETLSRRLQEQAAANNAIIVLPNLVGAWTRKPS